MMFVRLSSNAPYICARCISRQRQRSYSVQSSPNTPGPPPVAGASKLTNRRLISLLGPDAPKFLQGIITNNLKPDSTHGFYAAFLTAPGKVLHDTFIYPTIGSHWHKVEIGEGNLEEPGYLVEVDSEQAEVLLKHLKRHKLRSKFRMRLLAPGELNVWSLWREGERWTAHGREAEGGPQNERILGLTDGRAPGMGQRLLLPENATEALGDVELAPCTAYTIRRYLKGVPEGQKEMPRDDCLPMNCNVDLMGGIDFRKGCYLGQELTIRTHHTGVVRRRILPVAIYDQANEIPETLEYNPEFGVDGAILSGLDIRKDDKRKRSTGKFIAGIGNIGLGMCRLEQMSDLSISGEPNAFKGEDRFVVQCDNGKELGLRAFVPDWVRGGIREPRLQRRVG